MFRADYLVEDAGRAEIMMDSNGSLLSLRAGTGEGQCCER